MRISNNSHEIHVYKLGGLTFVIPPGISVTTSDGGVVITQFDVDVETSVTSVRRALRFSRLAGRGSVTSNDEASRDAEEIGSLRSQSNAAFTGHTIILVESAWSAYAFGIKGTVANTRTWQETDRRRPNTTRVRKTTRRTCEGFSWAC